MSEIKTKEGRKVLDAIGVPAGNKVVVLATSSDENVFKSLRNLERVLPLDIAGLNVYDLLNAKYLVVTEKALEGIEARFA